MRSIVALLVATVLVVGLAGCASAAHQPAEQAYIANSQGAVSAGTRSALDGSPAPGRQEIVALYIPPILGLPGLPDFRAGVTVDPSGLQFPIMIPPPAFVAPANTAQTVEVQETYMVPETRMVQRTRTVQKVVVPIPQAAPNPCAPAPAPQRACPPPPVSSAAPLPEGSGVCRPGDPCDLSTVAHR